MSGIFDILNSRNNLTQCVALKYNKVEPTYNNHWKSFDLFTISFVAYMYIRDVYVNIK